MKAYISEPPVPAEDGLVRHVVVNVHLIEKVWAFYIVFDAVAIDVNAGS